MLLTRAGALSLIAVLAGCARAPTSLRTPDPALSEWKRGAVCYEIFVRSFFDSDGDGTGDLNGIIQKLDYVNDGNPATQRDLGARCIWLMPVAESPSYHGYDVVDYYKVDVEYGTNEDFKRLVAEAHRRGIRVLVDLVLNHASSEHPFFRQALRDPASPYRSWFLWSPTNPAVGSEAEGNWHRSPLRSEYYYGFFWSGMPDLNFRSAAVREEAKKIATFWLREMGADGFRLDAIRHLLEEGNQRENVRGTHDVLREFAAHVRRVAPEAFTIGEVWDSNAALLAYYPDQLDAYFVFEASDAIIESVKSGSPSKLLAPFLQLQRLYPADRWSPFLRNHDQTRTLTELKGDIGRAKVAATLLLTLPGLPFVYYGEEIGMTGDKPDPRLRTPMHWNRGANAGFTTGVPWDSLQPDWLTANVEVHEADPRSLLNLHRRLIHLRSEHRALGAGELVPLESSNSAVVAYLRRDDTTAVLVVTNLGAAPVSDVSLSSAARVLSAGELTATNLLGGPPATPLTVGADGMLRSYIPFPSIGAMESQVIALSRRTP